MSDGTDLPGFHDGADVIALRSPTGEPVPVPRELALANSRPFRAYSDHLDGWSYAEIAERHGYADARAAALDIKLWTDQARSLYNSFSSHERRAVQVARLEAMLPKLMEQARKGNVPAATAARGIITDIVKIEGLDQLKDEDDKGDARTVIVGGSEDEYIGSLERESKRK